MALPKKFNRLPILPVLLLILFGVTLAGAQEADILIDNPDAYREKHRAAVDFPHDLHVGDFDCLACHHDYKNGVNILDEEQLKEGNKDILCTTCHDENAEIGPNEAYHHQCIGCHREFRINRCCLVRGEVVWLVGSAPGPELCGECHIK